MYCQHFLWGKELLVAQFTEEKNIDTERLSELPKVTWEVYNSK